MTKPSLISQCLQATGADEATAERAAMAAMEPDIITLWTQHLTVAFVRLGRSPENAREDALDFIDVLLEDAARQCAQDVRLSAALRSARIYRMRCQGLKVSVIHERLGYSPAQIKRDYKAELARRHGHGIPAAERKVG